MKSELGAGIYEVSFVMQRKQNVWISPRGSVTE